jgi:uncharacterized delta-60 repeat protein
VKWGPGFSVSRGAKCASFLLVSVTATASAANQGAGVLDHSFGHEGKTKARIGSASQATALAQLSRGRLVVAGNANVGGRSLFALARYGPNGRLDPSFGSRGKVATAIGKNAGANAVAVDAEGRILAAGSSATGAKLEVALVRYNPNGSLDRSFGVGGRVLTSVSAAPASDIAFAMLLEPDGKIVIAGSSNWRFLLLRYDQDGSLDHTFGAGGIVTTTVGLYGRAYALARQSDGRLIAGGGFGPELSSFTLVRYDANGVLDKSFGSGGVVKTKVGGWYDQVRGLAITKRGKILAGGWSSGGTPSGSPWWRFGLVRYLPNGAVDRTFGVTEPGMTRTPIGSAASAQAIAITTHGQIVLAGDAVLNGKDLFALARYHANGRLDRSFGRHGIVTTSFGTGRDVGSALTAERHRSVVAGTVDVGAGDDEFGLARYWTTSPCRIPNVVGQRLRRAEHAIAAHHCRLGELRYRRASGAPKKVLSQQPRNGQRPPRAKISLVVSYAPSDSR